jgi:hypothetical protein
MYAGWHHFAEQPILPHPDIPPEDNVEIWNPAAGALDRWRAHTIHQR